MTATADPSIDTLYAEHYRQVTARYDEALNAHAFDAVAIGAGAELVRIFDDQHYPFSPNPHFVQWLPLQQPIDSVLIYRPGQRAECLVYQPVDIWRRWPEIPAGPWHDHIDIRTVDSHEALTSALERATGRLALLGDPQQWRQVPEDATINPAALLDHLHYYRPQRSDYEVDCIRAATRAAVAGHAAAGRAFGDGASEFDILIAFMAACGQTENELPYPAIIAKNHNGAVLHYQHYSREPEPNDSLLIDAGCAYRGYASDITRTHSADRDFGALIEKIDEAQQALAGLVRPGISFADLHGEAHARIGMVLKDSGIVTGRESDPVADGITAAFFPHGLGHYLGLQVHELGGNFAAPDGSELERDERFPHLRLVRQLEAGQVLTIEPGLYFIDSLLDQLRQSPAGGAVDWSRVEALKKFGGIRIEDNVLVTTDGHENLTRAAFAAAGQA